MNESAATFIDQPFTARQGSPWAMAAGMLLVLGMLFFLAQPLRAAENEAQTETGSKAVQQDAQDAPAANSGQSEGAAAENRVLTGHRGLVGREVRNLDGETIGEVENVLVDADGNKVQAVVSVGGFWGIGDEEIIVPLEKMQLNKRRDYVFFNGSEAELKAFPNYQEPAWRSARYDSVYRERMYWGPPARYTWDPYYDGDRRGMQRMHPRDRGDRYYSNWNHYEDLVPRYGMRGYYHDGYMGSRAYPYDDRRTYGEPFSSRRGNDIGSDRGASGEKDRWYGNRRSDFTYDQQQRQRRLKASDLIGMSVKNAQGETIGEVDDILVASSGRLDLLISVGEFLGMGGKQIRADLTDVELDDPNYVFYDISNREMENQPEYRSDER